jgi:1,4-dihydroxy-2-naphthoyl-CoA hydrolase
MKIWKQEFNLEGLNAVQTSNMGGFVGIEFTEIGDDYLVARMPVDERTMQPLGLLHGGASCVLSETLGSVAGFMSLADMSKQTIVGVEINANHLSSARGGFVYGTVRPIRVGRTMMVWNTEIKDEQGKLLCVSRLTVAVVERK